MPANAANRAQLLLLLVASCVAGCGQVRHDGDDGRGEAGGGGARSPVVAGSGGAAGANAGAGGSSTLGGSSITLGGGAGSEPVEPLDPDVAVPLGDTRQCNNEFIRVEQLPDTPLFFSGVFDGEPTEAHQDAADTDLPGVSIFRFGGSHVEAVSLAFYLGDAFSVLLQVAAANCELYSTLSRELPQPSPPFMLESGAVRSTTHSVDGFVGVTTGTLRARWVNDAGERHVLEADFALESYLPDARVLD